VSAVPRLELTGELTIQTAVERKAVLAEVLETAAQARATSLELDLAEVAELDTAGLQLLLLAQREAASFGCRLRFAAMSQAVSDVLAIVRLGADLDERFAGASAPQTPDSQESKP
jgi:anti-anti-sigma factor